MPNRTIEIHIDNRIRLMSAVLSATDWPQKAHERKGHRPHTHARNTARHLESYRGHPAVTIMQALLDKGAPLEAFYTYALKLSWPHLNIEDNPPWVPESWSKHLRDFSESSDLRQLWDDEQSDWDKARTEAESVMDGADFYTFLRPFVGPIAEQLVYMPNISYPSDRAIGVRVDEEIICIGHPRIAWGDNPPWPFDEDKAHIYSTALSEYARLVMLAYLRQNAEAVAPVTEKSLPVDEEFKQRFPAWGDQFVELFVPANVALYLERFVSPQEARAFILMEKKAKGVTILPGVVSVLQRYLNEFEDNNYTAFTEYLPHFPGHLRVAKTISAI